jgi:4-hydroxybenzoate polyprenyltransferase
MNAVPLSPGARWLTYFRERFPLLGHGVPIAVWVLATQGYARVQSGSHPWAGVLPFGVACVTALLVFLQLRILDEFKDYEDDARYRPYRPVPRGLVSLRQLERLGILAGCIQLVASAALGMASVAWLLLIWAYAWLMREEFFAPRWLRAHAAIYMASHMVIVPLILLYLVSCAGVQVRDVALAALAGASYLTFCVFEVGRKIRAPADEREGVDMYSRRWGLRRALGVWLGLLAAAALFAVLAAPAVTSYRVMSAVVIPVLLVASIASWRFLRDPRPGGGKVFLALSATWMLILNLALAVLAFAVSYTVPVR